MKIIITDANAATIWEDNIMSISVFTLTHYTYF